MDPWDEFRALQADEYGTYVAVEPIYVGTALAYNPGDAVPVSNVKAHGYDKSGQVVKRGTAAKPSTPTTNK